MGSLCFPQLTSGTLAQYPVVKEQLVRTIRNVLRDGSLISYPDSGASRLSWSLAYEGLSQADVQALKALFDACEGPLQPFTFVDPTGNALAWSADLSNSVWQHDPSIAIAGGAADPVGGMSAFTVTNNGQAFAQLAQTVTIPSNYEYCFSLYVSSVAPTSLLLLRQGATLESTTSKIATNVWTRVESSGKLNDGGKVFTAGVRLAPGQSIQVYGPQLEAQRSSSPYRSTTSVSGVFSSCYWATEEIAIRADAPYSYSTLISLEIKI